MSNKKIESKKILLVEDNLNLLEQMNKLFQNQGYYVDTCSNANNAFELIKTNVYDAIILDLCLSNNDTQEGFELIRKIKLYFKNNKLGDNLNSEASIAALMELPIVVLSGKLENSLESKINVLKMGIDYILKPVSSQELLLKISNLISRNKPSLHYNVINLGGFLEINLLKKQVFVISTGVALNFTPTQFHIFKVLAEYKGYPLSRTYLVRSIQQYKIKQGGLIQEKNCDVHICNMKREIARHLDPLGIKIDFIKAVPGDNGYKMEIRDEKDQIFSITFLKQTYYHNV